MKNAPSPNGPNGRDAAGRFAPGWRGGPGNPHARKVAQLRSALLAKVKSKDMREMIAALLAEAKAGNVAAAQVIERTLGKPVELDFIERMEAMERTIAELKPQGLS
jgi:hypothetical protein